MYHLSKILFAFCFIVFIYYASKINAQEQLSLEDAVLYQRSKFSPKSIPGIQWIKDTELLSFYSEDFSSMMSMDTKMNKKIIVNVTDINNALNFNFKRTPYPNWISSDAFYFKHDNSYYSYDVTTKKGRQLLTFSVGAENLDYHSSTNQIAYTIGNNLYIGTSDNPKIQVTKVDDNTQVVCGQSIARSEFGINKGTFWSPNGNYLAFYQKNETDVADYPLLDINVTPGVLNSVKYPMAGQKSEYAQVGVYNPKTQRTIFLKIYEQEKDQYLTNLAWDPNEKFIYLAVVNRAQNHLWFNKYDAKSGDFIKTLFEEKHPKYVEPENPAWFIPGSPEEFIWMSERDGFMHLYHYNNDGLFLGQISSGNWVAESILGLDDSKKNIIVSGTDESGLNHYTYKISLKGKKTELLTKEKGFHITSLNSDGSLLLDNFSNLTTPREIKIIDVNKNKSINNLLQAENPLRNYKVGKVELLTLKSNDGTELHARLIKPSDFDSTKKYPVIVYVYGGPHAQMVNNSWMGASPLWMQYQAEKGYLIFTLDNRGSKSRGFEFENIIHRQLGTVEIADQMIGVEWLKSQKFVNSNKMAVHGWSFGGFMTISMMLRTPDVFKVGVAGGAVTDWKFYEVMYGERYMDQPNENPEGYEKARLHNYVGNLKGDLLMIHGTSDDVVLEQHSLSLVKAFVENGVLIDYFPYPMHKHNVIGKDRVHLIRKVLSYIDEKLSK